MANWQPCVEMKWNGKEHTHALAASMFDSMSKGYLVDVTLEASGQELKAHKIVLSSASSYFQKLFAESPHLTSTNLDLPFNILEALVQYCYLGELKIHAFHATACIKAGKWLGIKDFGGFSNPDESQISKPQSLSDMVPPFLPGDVRGNQPPCTADTKPHKRVVSIPASITKVVLPNGITVDDIYDPIIKLHRIDHVLGRKRPSSKLEDTSTPLSKRTITIPKPKRQRTVKETFESSAENTTTRSNSAGDFTGVRSPVNAVPPSNVGIETALQEVPRTGHDVTQPIRYSNQKIKKLSEDIHAENSATRSTSAEDFTGARLPACAIPRSNVDIETLLQEVPSNGHGETYSVPGCIRVMQPIQYSNQKIKTLSEDIPADPDGGRFFGWSRSESLDDAKCFLRPFSKLTCRACDQPFGYAQTFIEHLFWCSNKYGNLLCPRCKLRFPKIWGVTSFVSHLSRCSPGDPVTSADLQASELLDEPSERDFANSLVTKIAGSRKHEAILCKFCNKGFKSRSGLNRHMQLKHSDNNSGAQISHVQMQSDEDDSESLNLSSSGGGDSDVFRGFEEESCPCPHCGKIFLTASQISNHIKKDHDKPSNFVSCLHCKRAFKDWASFLIHLRSDCRNQLINCEICSFRTHREMFLHIHKLQVHEIPSTKFSYKCSKCPQMFQFKSNLQLHNVRPCSESNFECHTCCKRLASKTALMYHLTRACRKIDRLKISGT